MKTINCQGKLICFDTPKIMGIINTTPDSFFAESRTFEYQLLTKVEGMLSQGATFIDIGGYSTRPNAEKVSEIEEIKRVVPSVEIIKKNFPEALISVDTFRSKVAEESILAGACIINDISAGIFDENMWQVIKNQPIPYIAMHLKGNLETMHEPQKYQNITKEIIFYFSQIKKKAQEMGINDLILDPGFGFSKNIAQNYELFNNLELFNIFENPILVGISRKSMIYKLLETSAENALNGTSVLDTIAVLKGADILRCHDVKEAVECVKIVNQLNINHLKSST